MNSLTSYIWAAGGVVIGAWAYSYCVANSIV